jgi:F-type H+-transporting ATPase subunit gamma
VIGHIAHANSEYQHPFLVEREEIKRVGYVIVSTDRGLCGGLNTNLFRNLLGQIRVAGQGRRSRRGLHRPESHGVLPPLKVNMLGSVTHLGEKPQLDQLIGVIKVMLDAYTDGRIDRLFAGLQRLRQHHDPARDVPTSCCRCRRRTTAKHARLGLPVRARCATVLDHVLTRYVESLVYQATLENLASPNTRRAWWP